MDFRLRCARASGPWGVDLYSHNGVGNLTNFDRTAGGVTTSRVLGDAANSNRILVTLLNGVTERSFIYDAAGNVTGDNRGVGGR